MKISSFVAGIFCLVSAFAWGEAPVTSPEAKLSLRQKIGQVMIWSFGGAELAPELEAQLVKYQPGALIVFRRNINTVAQVALLNERLQKLARTRLSSPFLLMIDQEGGLVTRIRTPVPMPSALALARMDDEAFIEGYAQTSADVLALLGFNVNLAPVLDISNPKQDSFIGNRTFGNDPESVSRLTMAYARGLSRAHLLPTAKHFPGHGGTKQDSHQTTPRKTSTLAELKAHDFIPFGAFAQADFPRAIMMAHLALPNVDASGLPATYSSTLIQEHLRGSLGYKGLLMTDDLEMSGAAVAKDIGERAVRAFLAGNDMLMLAGPPSHQRKAFAALLAAVNSGRISRERLDESVRRILAAKAAVPETFTRPSSARLRATFGKLNELSKKILQRNFEIAASGAPRAFEALDAQSIVTVFSSSPLFFQKFQGKFHGRTKFVQLTPTSLGNARREIEASRSDLLVVFASGAQTAHWLDALPAELKSKIAVVNCNHPGEITDQSAFATVLNVNSYFTDSGQYLAEWLNQSASEDPRGPADERAPSGAGDAAPTTTEP